MLENPVLARWVCLECHYIYDPAKGDPKGGILPGIPFENLPDTWRCPECNILKVKKGVLSGSSIESPGFSHGVYGYLRDAHYDDNKV